MKDGKQTFTIREVNSIPLALAPASFIFRIMTGRLFLMILCLLLQDDAFAAGWKVDFAKLIASARSQVGVTRGYDPRYRVLA